MRDVRGTSQRLMPDFCVPYVPTLGPVHPEAITLRLWDDVLTASTTGEFLPYDKDARWGGVKRERVLGQNITDTPNPVMIPTLQEHADGSVVHAHHYGHLDVEQAREHAAKLAADHGAQTARIVWLTPTPQPRAGRCRRILLKSFGAQEPDPPTEMGPLHGAPAAIRATWPDFATAMAGTGFQRLAHRMAAGRDDGPVLVAVAARRIVGAIGPMAVQPDPAGRPRLLPQYFAVLPGHRGAGHGRALWQAAMYWGHRAGAQYQLLQTALHGASDRLCGSEGLATLGFATTITV